ncbi:MAG TPA: ferritin-like domain-containing protein [Thermoanaerobaculia bacterium]|nr:ferritin-like domain-containing protein [Thermoanaerobaculia bacterium]
MSDDPEFDLLKKKRLIPLLREAAEIEQQVMVQYLYAAYSLKKFPDSTCTPTEFEYVRRWGTVLMSVARSEMEHLALVNGMLSAVGAHPNFKRQNIPVQFSYYKGESLARGRDEKGTEPCDIPFLFERFNLDIIGRFVCIESPSRETLAEYPDLPVPEWCFSCGGDAAPRFRLSAEKPYPAAESQIPQELWAEVDAELGVKMDLKMDLKTAAPDSLQPGSIQELYDQIADLFKYLNGRGNLFTGNPSSQVFVPVEYQVNIFPITDLSTALSAIRLITEEGEGMDAPPDYQSHFLRFFTMHDELAELLANARKKGRRFEPALPLPLNPRLEKITNPFARDLFELFNYTYATLLFLLTALYKDFVPLNTTSPQSYPFFSAALQENAFGPMMTMLIRPMAEVLAYTASGDGEHTTGPDYRLSHEDLQRLGRKGSAELGNIDFFLGRFDEIVRRLDGLRSRGDGDLVLAAREEGDLPFLRRQLDFVYESAVAMGNNTRRIYQLGQLPQFVVNPS